jgi:hypothetical protein
MTVSRPLELVLFYVAKLDVARNGLGRVRPTGPERTSLLHAAGEWKDVAWGQLIAFAGEARRDETGSQRTQRHGG